MAQIQGGPAIPVSVVTGGKIKGGKAIPVYGYTSTPTDGRRAAAGPARPVYVVSDAQMAAGMFQLEGGPAMPMYVAPSGLSVVGDAAQPVYVVGGSLGGAFTPASIAGLVAWYQPKGAASLATSYVNLANPGTYNAAPGTAPTLDANGWVFNGSTQYLKTGVIPNGATWSALIQFVNATGTGDRNPLHAYKSSTDRFGFDLYYTGNTVYYDNGGAGNNTGTITSGNLAITNKGYKNGVDEGFTIASPGGSTLELYIGALNNNGSPAGYFAGTVVSVAIYNVILTSAQVAQLVAYMAAL